MRVLIAPDKFKGSLSAVAVADHIAHGIARAGVDTTTLPLADGGDGSVAAALASGMQRHACTVSDAHGRPHTATIAVEGHHFAVVEVANTCGLSTLSGEAPAPMTASSYGFGQAIWHAIGLGVKRLVLALGGSASTDGGVGMLAALGYTFHDGQGHPIEPIASNLTQIHHVRADDSIVPRGVDITVASDVRSPLTGPTGAAAIYGPQKGATVADIDRLEAGLDQLVTALQRTRGPEASIWAHTPGAGAAGGIGFATLCLGAQIVSGGDYFLDLLNFDQHLPATDLVVTGEGRLDRQTLAGKLPAVVAKRAAPTPVIAVVGRTDLVEPTGPFAETYSVADYAATDTARDPERTAMCLTQVGTYIGQRLMQSSSAAYYSTPHS